MTSPVKPRRRRRPALSLPAILALVLLAFGVGIGVGGWLRTPSAVTPAAPHTPTPVPPTPTAPASPTPTAPELGAAPGAGAVLETLYLDVAPDDVARIEAKRQEALERWILLASDADFVPGTVRWRGETLPVELRLKGDWADHFAHDKWSFRIHTEGDAYLDGMRVFSLQDPGTRTYLNEWLFLHDLRAQGVLAVDYDFVRVVLNGEYQGIYALEEGFAKELLESQGRREGVVLRYAEDLLWTYWAAYEDDLVTPRGVTDFYLIDEFQSGRVNEDPALAAQRDAAVGMLRALWTGERSPAEVFDVDALATYLALSDVWGAQHAQAWHNLRYYYDPIAARLEPVAFDTQPLAEEVPVDLRHLRGLQWVVEWGDAALQRAYVRHLWAYSQPGYLAQVHERFGARFAALRAALAPEFGTTDEGQAATEDPLAPPWDHLARRQAALRELLTPLQMTYAYRPAEAPTDTLTLDVGNLLDFPVEIVGVEVGDAWLPARPGWAESGTLDLDDALVLPPLARDAAFIDYVRLRVPAASEAPIRLTTRLWPLTRTVTQPVSLVYAPPLPAGPRPAPPSLEDVLARHPYLRLAEEDRTLTLPAGTWVVSGSLVLPQGVGLRLGPGTTLRFGPESYLLARGPLIFEGAADRPVTLAPQRETWRGVLVLDAGATSRWRHVVVQDTDAIDRAGWSLTGGVTFYRSPVQARHVLFQGSQAEDALNIVHTSFELVDSEFTRTRSDAFDGDFVRGSVTRCAFYALGADGIDVSGADVRVRDVRMADVGDKALSVGEASHLVAEGLVLTDVGFGVVAKDLSQVTITQVAVRRARRAALAAYIKKPAYGPATLTARDVTFEDVPAERHTLVQTGSWIDLEGRRIWGEDVDVEALYETRR